MTNLLRRHLCLLLALSGCTQPLREIGSADGDAEQDAACASKLMDGSDAKCQFQPLAGAPTATVALVPANADPAGMWVKGFTVAGAGGLALRIAVPGWESGRLTADAAISLPLPTRLAPGDAIRLSTDCSGTACGCVTFSLPASDCATPRLWAGTLCCGGTP